MRAHSKTNFVRHSKITLVPIVGGTSYFMLLFISKDSFVLEILNQMKMKL